MEEQNVTFKSGNASIKAFLVKPDKEGKGAVLAVHEVYGLDDVTKDYCRRLAREGFLVLCPDLYSREGTTPMPDHNAILRKLQATPDKRAVDDLHAAVEFLRLQGAEKIALVGFAMGGTWAMLHACWYPEDTQACVSFYGSIMREPAHKKALIIDEAPKLKCPLFYVGPEKEEEVYLLSLVLPRDVKRLAERLTQLNKSFEIKTYPANYNFLNPALKAYDKTSAEDAWKRATEFLKRHL